MQRAAGQVRSQSQHLKVLAVPVGQMLCQIRRSRHHPPLHLQRPHQRPASLVPRVESQVARAAGQLRLQLLQQTLWVQVAWVVRVRPGPVGQLQLMSLFMSTQQQGSSPRWLARGCRQSCLPGQPEHWSM